jgi:hypothetical protein
MLSCELFQCYTRNMNTRKYYWIYLQCIGNSPLIAWSTRWLGWRVEGVSLFIASAGLTTAGSRYYYKNKVASPRLVQD